MSERAANYRRWLEEKEQEWERRCLCCGACCGALEDPCEQLAFSETGAAFCRVYSRRFDEEHKTLSGHPVKCVPVRSKLHTSWPGDEKCGYKRRY